MLAMILFGVLAGVTLVAAVGVVASRTIFVAALWLVLSFLGVAGLYVLLGAGFLAAVQVLIYVGAISVLILFAVMLTPNAMGTEERTNRQWVLGVTLVLVLFGMLAALMFSGRWPVAASGGIMPEAGGTLLVASKQTTGTTAAALPSEDDARRMTGVIERPAPGGGSEFFVPGPITMIGRAFMTDYLLPFELISLILLMALVGAVVVARE